MLPLELTPAEAHAVLLTDAEAVLVDVREADELAICKVEGAEWMPLSRFADEGRNRWTGSRQRVLLLCHHGMRSLRATEFLRALGCEQAQSVRGGIDRWADELAPEMARY